jgi:hypothetical protein
MTVTAKAGGAQKLVWILKRDGKESVVATDRFSFAFDAGRVTGDKAVMLQCKAVYPGKIETKDIAISIKEEIPDPSFTLTAPANWDGRTAITAVVQVTNLSAMEAKGAGELKTEWIAGPFAVIKHIAPFSSVPRTAGS